MLELSEQTSKTLQEMAVNTILSLKVTLRDQNLYSVRLAIGDAEVVLIGEATHGTEEFYAMR
jgi:erythromycin esterase-like protein